MRRGQTKNLDDRRRPFHLPIGVPDYAVPIVERNPPHWTEVFLPMSFHRPPDTINEVELIPTHETVLVATTFESARGYFSETEQLLPMFQIPVLVLGLLVAPRTKILFLPFHLRWMPSWEAKIRLLLLPVACGRLLGRHRLDPTNPTFLANWYRPNPNREDLSWRVMM